MLLNIIGAYSMIWIGFLIYMSVKELIVERNEAARIGFVVFIISYIPVMYFIFKHLFN